MNGLGVVEQRAQVAPNTVTNKGPKKDSLVTRVVGRKLRKIRSQFSILASQSKLPRQLRQIPSPNYGIQIWSNWVTTSGNFHHCRQVESVREDRTYRGGVEPNGIMIMDNIIDIILLYVYIRTSELVCTYKGDVRYNTEIKKQPQSKGW